MTRTHLLGVAVLLALALPLVIDALTVSDEEQVDALVDELLEAVEAMDTAALVARATEDFQALSPPLRAESLAEAERSLERLFRQVRSVEVRDVDRTIDVEGDTARVELTTLLRIEHPMGIVPIDVTTTLRIIRIDVHTWQVQEVERLAHDLAIPQLANAP